MGSAHAREDIAIIGRQADVLERMVQDIRASDLPFDRWFIEQAKEIPGFGSTERNPGGKPSEKRFELEADQPVLTGYQKEAAWSEHGRRLRPESSAMPSGVSPPASR